MRRGLLVALGVVGVGIVVTTLLSEPGAEESFLLGLMPRASSTETAPDTADAPASTTLPDVAAASPLAPTEPTFFFDDAHDALGDRRAASRRTLQETTSTPDEPATGSPVRTQTVAVSEQGNLERTRPDPIADPPALVALREQAETPQGGADIDVTVGPGDTLSGILNDHGVSIDQMPLLLTDEVVARHLSQLKVGQVFSIAQDADGSFHSLSARVGEDTDISIRRASGGFAVAAIDLPIEKERVVTSGTIEQSLYLAAEQANLKQSTIMALAEIFQWELDFARDIRKGDHFAIVYDRLYRDGNYIGDGDILAAEFQRGGRAHRAIRFVSDDGSAGYYSPEGVSKRRTFTRHPVDVVRVTSKFNPNRLHPVLQQRRAHRGVDYGSPHGSPIRATADGIVKHAGTRGGYGKTVILQHGQRITTLYAHMSRISDKSRIGTRVRQGDVIGYVGKTGRVTGTHLHYEFRVNGTHVDPLTVELPAASPIDTKSRNALAEMSEELIAQMRSVLPNALSAVATNDTRAVFGNLEGVPASATPVGNSVVQPGTCAGTTPAASC